MAVIIVDTGTASFTINGVTYLKNFQSLVVGNSIRIVNAYDSKLVLLSETLYSEFTVDGNTFANALLLQEDLVSKLFNRPATGPGTLETSTSNTLSFHNTAGVRHGTFAAPITGNMILDTSGGVEGGVVVVIWNGSSDPSFTGGIVESYPGGITGAGTYSIYLHYINGRFNINIFNVSGEQPVINTPDAPTALNLTEGILTPYAPTALILTEGVVASPVISNFIIEDAQPTRVYFDSNRIITASTVTGFTISEKTISSVTIQAGLTTGHYFTVTSSFDHFSNNTIRYEGGSNIVDLDSNIVYDFTMQYINNNITEPTTSTTLYVDVSTGDDTDDGSTEALAFATIDKAASVATAGTTVWVKAGNYGNENVVIDNSGTVTNPIKFIGYKTTIGDITSMYFTYGDVLDSSEMPKLTGSSRSSGTAIYLNNGKDYIMFKNFQTEDYLYGIFLESGSGSIIDNCISIDNGDVANAGYGFSLTGSTSDHGRILNSITINATSTNIFTKGDYHLVKGCKSYSFDDPIGRDTSYFYSTIDVENNIFLDNYAKRDGNTAQFGHGLSLATLSVLPGDDDDLRDASYNLVDGHETVNIIKVVEFRHGGSHHNVARNLVGYGDGTGSDKAGSIMFRDGAHHNIVENSNIQSNIDAFIMFYESTETQIGLGDYNIVKNSIFRNGLAGLSAIRTDNVNSVDAAGSFNKIYNNTFYNITKLFDDTGTPTNTMTNCEFKNNIVHTVTTFETNNGSDGWTLDYNNFYNGFAAQGTNTNTDNPNFIDTTDFVPQNALLKSGVAITDVEYDRNDLEREDPPTFGAVEI